MLKEKNSSLVFQWEIGDKDIEIQQKVRRTFREIIHHLRDLGGTAAYKGVEKIQRFWMA